MRKKLSLSIMSLCVLLIACGEMERENQLTNRERQDGWQLLFDGETMQGWRAYNSDTQSDSWTVEDGTLKALGKGSDETGYIVTEGQYENFILSFDWKISEGGNSGVMYHVVERPEFPTPYVTGPEYQVIDDEGFPHPLEEWQMAGADYAMYEADKSKKKLMPVGEWNNSRIVFDNGHVEHWLNGEKIVEFEAWSDDWFERKNSGKWTGAPEYGLARTGHISLQDHGDVAWYRNIKIKELPRQTQEVNLFNGKDLTGWEVYGTEKWFVEDGILVCESGPDKDYGYLATREYYQDFDLSVDFKQEADGNSGIFFRSIIEDGTTKISGWQVEVAPPNHDTGGIYESYGRGWLVQIPDEKENILQMGEWNTMRIRVEGGTVNTWLNGEHMVELEDEKIANAQGRIALQIHDGGGIRVLWRNLILKQL
jgi:hypothetical protein